LSETTSGREPFIAVQIDQDFCTRTYGVAPCTAATPTNKCFNTLATCQDPNNYEKGERTISFCKPGSDLPTTQTFIPSVASVSTAPTKINPTNVDRNSSPLGQRAAATIVFDDHPHSDFQVDPYLADRNYYPLDRGTFWSKWVARNPYYQNRPLRIYEQYINEDLEIEIVGQAGAGGSTSATITIPSGAKKNDLILLFIGSDGNFPGLPSGYTNVNTYKSTFNEYARFAYKVVGDTPETTVSITGSVATAGIVMVLRNADISLVNVAVAESELTTGMPNPPSQSTVFDDGGICIAVGFLDDNNIASSVTAPAGFTNLLAVEATVTGQTVMVASQFPTSTAAIDPAAFGGSAADEWVALTVTMPPISGFRLDESRVRSYFIDSVQGPDSTGRVQIVAKDPLKLADRQKAQVPTPSLGTLRIAINTTDTTIDIGLAVLADYPAPGIVRINDELITYTTSAIETISSVNYVRLTGVTRGTKGSIAASHAAAALVQICTEYDDEKVWDVVYDLLTTYAGIDSAFIPYSDWDAEGTVWLAQFNVSAILSQPRGVGEILGEILEQVLLYIWWDERDQQIKLRAIRPLIGNAPTFSDNANIIENTVGLTTDPKNRVSQIWVYFDQSNKAEALDKESNFKKLRIRADLEAESPEKYGESRVRKIYARWIQNDAQAINLSARLLGASFENPKILKLRVDAKDRAVWTADIVDILHRNIVDFTGSPTLERYQVLSVEEVLPGEVVQYEMQKFIFKGTRFGFYMATNAPTYAAATQDEKDGNAAWYSDANGLMADGLSGWEYQ
jgi:hypothetical protein